MFVKRIKTKNGRINIAISQSYRDANGKSKSRVVKGLGYLDVIAQHHDDPEAYIKEQLDKIQREYDQQNLVTQLPIALSESLEPEDALLIKNFGYAALSRLYHELEIDYFINNRRRYTDASYNHNAILKLLVYSRLITPGSKKHSWEQRMLFFDKTEFTLAQLYRSLEFFADHSDDLLTALDARIERLFGRDRSIFYYDVTNFYFEITREDDLRKRGFSKEHRPLPIIQMGLFNDAQGIPLSFKLFEGNTNDHSTFAPALRDLQTHHDPGSRYIVVADNAMFSGDNLRRLLIEGNGFIVAYSLKGGKQEIQNQTFDTSGYSFYEYTVDPKTGKRLRHIRDWDPHHPQAHTVYRFKELVMPFEIKVSTIKGKSQTIQLDAVKIVITYSPEYAAKAQRDREKVLEKTQRIIQSRKLFGSHDSRKYIQTTEYSTESGEQVETEQVFGLDEDKIACDAMFDGFHAVLTSELDLPATEIIRHYRGLWEIEETFRISKHELKSRPVFVSKEKHIKAHFLICFLSLTLLRLLDKQMNDRFSTREILENLKSCKAHYLGDNIFRFYHTSECLEEIGRTVGIDFSRKYMTRKEIVSALAKTKKTAY